MKWKTTNLKTSNVNMNRVNPILPIKISFYNWVEYILLPLSVSGGSGVLRYGYPLLYSYSRPRSSGQQSTRIQSLSQHTDFIIPIYISNLLS